MDMAICSSLTVQMASIMEVLTKTALAEMTKLVDDAYAQLRLEISRSQRENEALKSRLLVMEGEPRAAHARGCGAGTPDSSLNIALEVKVCDEFREAQNSHVAGKGSCVAVESVFDERLSAVLAQDEEHVPVEEKEAVPDSLDIKNESVDGDQDWSKSVLVSEDWLEEDLKMSQSQPGSSGAAIAAANGGEGPVCDKEEVHMQPWPVGEPEKGLQAELKQEPEWEGEPLSPGHPLPGSAEGLEGSSAYHDKKAYRIVEEIPFESNEDDETDSCYSGDDWLPGKQRIAYPSSDSGPEDADGPVDAEDADGAVDTEDVGGADVPPARAKARKECKHVWRAKENQFEAGLPPFLGEWQLNVNRTEPIEFFTHLFPEELVNEMVQNTNLHALQEGKQNLEVTKEEMMTFLGINVAMSYIRYPRIRMYWSSEAGLRFDLIANAMPVNRFGQIRRYIHYVDNYSKKPGDADKLFKLRPVLESLEKSFRSAVDPEESQSVDEQIIPFKGKLLDNKVIPMAPTDEAQRWCKKDKKMLKVQRPFSVKLYNQQMGGVDQMDQTVAMYPHRRKKKRWYVRGLFHFLDATVVNAWRLERMSGLEQRDLQHFKASVARSLINAGSIQIRKRGRPSEGSPPPPPGKRRGRAVSKTPPEIKFAPGNHWPQLTDVKNANRCKDAACTRKTKYICMQCDVALCPGCFANFHTR